MHKNIMGGKKPRRVRNQNPPPQYKRGFCTVNKPIYMSSFDYLRYIGTLNN